MVKEFRYDISFLRAFSVILVVFYHFQIPYFKGGYAGVDVFFVISGFLMTNIILGGFDKENFNLLSFYKRRIQRIFPALITMIVGVGILIYIFLRIFIISYAEHAFASSVFISNITYYLEADYFSPAKFRNFLLHTWSLSVEWQFYLLFPLLLLILKKQYIKNKFFFRSAYLIILLASFAAMLYHNRQDHSLSFYIFYTRAWEMMAGGLAFIYKPNLKNYLASKKWIILLPYIALLGGLVFAGMSEESWPNTLTLLPVIATTVILFYNTDLDFYKNKIFKFLGDISYSLYLWHWPIYLFSYYFNKVRIYERLSFIILSIVLAALSYYFIEKKDYRTKTLPILAATSITFVVFFSIPYIDRQTVIQDSKLATMQYYLDDYSKSDKAILQYSYATKHFTEHQKFAEYDITQWEPLNDRENIILLGNSFAGMFSEALNHEIPQSKYHVIQVTTNSTFPEIDAETKFPETKLFWNYFFNQYFPKNHKKISTVIVGGNYGAYTAEELRKKVLFLESYFGRYNVQVVYLGQTHGWGMEFPVATYMNTTYNLNYKPGESNKQELLQELVGKRYINFAPYDSEIRKISKSGIPYISDVGHLTSFGANQYMKFAVKYMTEQNFIRQ